MAILTLLMALQLASKHMLGFVKFHLPTTNCPKGGIIYFRLRIDSS
jgi:hypothetical protein